MSINAQKWTKELEVWYACKWKTKWNLDVFEKQTSKSLQITPIIRSTVLPLTNQIITILIIITVLLLPIIK